MCVSGRGLVVGRYMPFWKGFGGRCLCAFQLGVGGRQLCALLLGVYWWVVMWPSVRG
jgi:hypothetical protein